MIVCPNCSHQNPEGATQCEACYTPLPTTTTCPNCGATVQSDAAFCGQCGYSLQPSGVSEASAESTPLASVAEEIPSLPQNITPDPLMEVEPIQAGGLTLEKTAEEPLPLVISEEEPILLAPEGGEIAGHSTTQLQQSSARLVHVQTNTVVELPQNLPVIHVGKPNQMIPPDIDVSSFPNSEIVSRTHADIRTEGDTYYIEDIGSSNGTYINNIPLQKGNRHRLRPGDRISLGKGDLVSFIFQLS
ncbi:MAG: FHA domain-containing protein [Microcoleaceae cyanobacterium]